MKLQLHGEGVVIKAMMQKGGSSRVEGGPWRVVVSQASFGAPWRRGSS